MEHQSDSIPKTVERLTRVVAVLTGLASGKAISRSEANTAQGDVEDAITTLNDLADEFDQIIARWIA
jgi:hypothetical protein